MVDILNQANSINPAMQFTVEHLVNDRLPHLTILIKRKEIGDLQENLTTVYRKQSNIWILIQLIQSHVKLM